MKNFNFALFSFGILSILNGFSKQAFHFRGEHFQGPSRSSLDPGLPWCKMTARVRPWMIPLRLKLQHFPWPVFRATTSERIARLGATRFRTGLASRQQRVSARPAECGIQRKYFLLVISNPAALNGVAYSSSEGI